MKSNFRTLVAATALVAAACDNPYKPNAQIAVSYDTLSVFALNSAPLAAPTALSLAASAPTFVTTAATFDIAFDIDPEGRAVLTPVQLAVPALAGSHRVGIRPASESFEAIGKAPTSGYVDTLVSVVPAGSVVTVANYNPSLCVGYYYTGYTTYSKLAIDSILPAEHRLRVRLAANNNCGFLSLVPGVPKE
jgi:hypothetical protein